MERSHSFQIVPTVRVYEYFQLQTFPGLLATVGGYLGLFLGFSVYTIFEIHIRTWVEVFVRLFKLGAKMRESRSEERQNNRRTRNRGQEDCDEAEVQEVRDSHEMLEVA